MTSQPMSATDARRDRVPVKSGPVSRPKAGRVLTRIVVVTALLVAAAVGNPRSTRANMRQPARRNRPVRRMLSPDRTRTP